MTDVLDCSNCAGLGGELIDDVWQPCLICGGSTKTPHTFDSTQFTRKGFQEAIEALSKHFQKERT